MGRCGGQTHALTALCAIAVAATMGAACGARTDLTSFGKTGTGSSGSPSSGSLASAGLGSSGSFAGAGTLEASGTIVSTGMTSAVGLAESGVLATTGTTSGSVAPLCPRTCEALNANCGFVPDGVCGGTVFCGTCATGEVCGANAPNVCGPTPMSMDAGGPTVLEDNQQSPTYIAVDPQYVYWTTSGSYSNVLRAPIAGGQPVAFENGISCFGITTEAGFVFAILTNATKVPPLATLTKAPSGGIGVLTLWSEPSQGAFAGPVANSTDLYWSDEAAGAIWQMGLDGSNAKIIAAGESTPSALALDLKNLYWQSQQGIRMMPLAGGTATTLGMPPPGPPIGGSAIAVDPLGVYSNPITPLCTVWQTSLVGGASRPLGLPMGQMCIPIPAIGRGLAADGKNVYWTLPVVQNPQSNTGEILRIAPTGGVSTTIASGQSFPFAVTLDSHFVYWTNHGGLNGGVGQVMRAPK